jgi:hypothetical protein
MNSLLSVYHNTSLQPYFALSSGSHPLLGPCCSASSSSSPTSHLFLFFSRFLLHLQKFAHSLSWSLCLHLVTYISIFYGLLFLIYSLRAEYVSSLYLSLLYAVYIFYTTLLLSLLWVPSLATTYRQHLTNGSSSSLSSVLVYQLATLSVCFAVSIVLIIFLFSLMMYPLSLETDISLWVFYCGLMVSVLYGMVIISAVWLLVVLGQGNTQMVCLISLSLCPLTAC